VSAPARAEPRTLAPPERRTAHVTAVERLGAYVLITALDDGGPPEPRPGQFYMLAAAERWGGGADERPYLPRAFSHARAREGRLSFLLDEVGPGTERLASLGAGEGLHLVGPLGIGWRPPSEGTRPVLVGGGIGAAPLLCLQDEFAGEGVDGHAPDVDRHIGDERQSGGPGGGRGPAILLGFRSAAYAEAATLFAGEPLLATDDGSKGHHGVVTDLLRDELDRDPAATVFACGPPPMLEAVRALCEERQVKAQLALESGMACGFGACFGCVVPTRAGYLRLCVDGPVLDAELLESALVPGAGH
jgi:dihydroorotate dehydrogenase electron transfer subunit